MTASNQMQLKTGRTRNIGAALLQAGHLLLIVAIVVCVGLWTVLTRTLGWLRKGIPNIQDLGALLGQVSIFLFLLAAIPLALIGTQIKSHSQVILKYLTSFEAVISVVAYLGAFLMVFAEVVAREVFGSALTGTKEAAILGSVVAGYMGFALVTSAGAHLRINALDGLVTERNERDFWRVSDLVSVFILLGIAFAAVTFIQGTYSYNDKVNTLLIPLWPFQLVVIYAFGATALKHLIFFCDPDSRPAPVELHG